MRRAVFSVFCALMFAPNALGQESELRDYYAPIPSSPSPLKQAEVLRALEAVRTDCGFRNDETVIRAAADAIAALPQLQGATEQIAAYDVASLRTYYDQLVAAHGERVTETEIARAAITAMVLSVDPRNQFIDLADSRPAGRGYTNMVLIGREDGIAVVSVAPSSGAESAGLQPNDLIEQVDGVSTAGRGTNDVFAMMRGDPDGETQLTVRRGGETLSIAVTRDTGQCQEECGVSGRVDGDVGVISVPYRINPGADSMVRAAVERIRAEVRRPRGYVLDLRGNRGGPTVPVINALADLFLDRGTIIRADTCATGNIARSPARRGDILNGAPLIVLIDGSTNSGAESVVAALVEHGRAVAVGQRTVGDGAARRRTRLTDTVSIRLVDAVFVTPSGAPIDGVGVTPTHVTDIPSDGRDPAMERALELLRQ